MPAPEMRATKRPNRIQILGDSALHPTHAFAAFSPAIKPKTNAATDRNTDTMFAIGSRRLKEWGLRIWNSGIVATLGRA